MYEVGQGMKITSLVRFNILTILMGLAVQSGIQMMIQFPRPSVFLNGAAFLLLALNFYHGKIAATESETHQLALGSHPVFALFDFLLNIAVVGAFVAMPTFLSNSLNFTVVNLVMRIVDTVLVVLTAVSLRQQTDSLERVAQWQWLGHNAIVLACLVGIGWLALVYEVSEFDLAYLLLSLMLIDVVSDYILNSRFYFGGKSKEVLQVKET